MKNIKAIIFSIVFSLTSVIHTSLALPLDPVDEHFKALIWQDHLRIDISPTSEGVIGNTSDHEWKVQQAQTSSNDTRMVFQSYRDGNWEIYHANGDGSAVTRLTNSPAADVHPRLSYDGQKIVFSSERDGNFEIYSMNWDGSGSTRLTNHSASDIAPSLSVDGSMIAFVSNRDGNYEIYVMNADGSTLRRMSNSQEDDYEPVWSPLGNKLAWISESSYNGDAIIMVNSDVSMQLSTSMQHIDCRYLGGLTWSPVGDKLAFDCDSDGDYWNEVQYLQFTNPLSLIGPFRVLVYDPNLPMHDAIVTGWSPDGQSIVFTLNAYRESNGALIVENRSVQKVSIKSKQSNVLPFSKGTETSTDWRWNDTIAPISSSVLAPRFAQFSASDYIYMTVKTVGIDAGSSGIFSIDVQKRIDGNEWQDVVAGLPFGTDAGVYTPLRYPEPAPKKFFFRARVRDGAGHVSLWSDGNDPNASTTLYLWELQGVLTDNRGQVGIDASIMTTPELPCSSTPRPSGYIQCFVVPMSSVSSSQLITMSWGANGYESPPPLTYWLNATSNMNARVYVYATDNVVVDGSFGEGASAWQFSPGGFRQIPIWITAGKADIAAYFGGSSASVAQTVTVPALAHRPTLSFVAYAPQYQNYQGTYKVEAYVIDGAERNLVISESVTETWRLYWADLSPWTGKTITLEVRSAIVTNAPYQPAMYVDDVSISSWLTPDPRSIVPANLPVNPAGVEITLSGDNFIAPVEIWVGDVKLTNPTWIDEKTVKGTLPANLPVGKYLVSVKNAGGQQTYLAQPLIVGFTMSIPVIQR